jgi:sugar phosphate isomerase/epimerase
MRLAVSNIAWPTWADPAVAGLLERHGVAGVELAPAKLWPRPAEVSEREALTVRRAWEERGVQVVALQALLFGRPELTLFDDAVSRARAVEYLAAVIRLAGWLGAGALVFGSPKNRLAGGQAATVVHTLALDTFRRLGEEAVRHRTTFCIEPNPREYGCDFITTVREAAELVEAVGHPGFGLHLDAGGMTLTRESPADAGPVRPRHYHISEPHLVPIGAGPHEAFADSLHRSGYDGWCSIEMRMPEQDWAGHLERSVERALRLYGIPKRPAARRVPPARQAG